MSSKESLKKVEFMRIVVKFKESDTFTALLKKDYHNNYDVGVVEIFYNICAKYQDLDYTLFGSELTSLIGEWLEV